ncbi:MAG: cyclic nucleotide-binding/CBS domain-containing protein [Acidimicrobiia bacterium]|jgi:CBS domain-containing protein
MSERAAVAGLPVSTFSADAVAEVPPSATLLEVADALTAGEVGAVVVRQDSKVVGVVSERDLVGALARRLPMDEVTAADVASTELVWADAAAPVGEVANEMLEHYVRHVLVEEDGELVGMVSARDLLGAYSTEAYPEDLDDLDDLD